MLPGKIFLIPTPIADADLRAVLPEELLNTLNTLDAFFVENIRTSRRFLSKAGIQNIQDIHFQILDKDTDSRSIEDLLNIVKKGKNIGIMSEAGCPGIADPGSRIIIQAHKHQIRVIPLVGPSSIFLALMASGFKGQSFQFLGYLPIDKREREKRIVAIERQVYANDQTQIFMETPYRNNQLLGTLLKILQPDTLLCIASEITSPEEFILSQPVKIWRKQVPDLHKKPTIFLLYK